MTPALIPPVVKGWLAGHLLRTIVVCQALVLLVAPPLVRAQEYPTRQIHFVVPAAAGGIADNFARIIGAKLREALGQPVVVENKAGAAGNIGTDFVAKAAPDGYTLVMGYLGSHAVNPSLFRQMPYDPVRDFVPVALVIEAEGVLVVHPSVQATSVRQLIDLAKAQPGKLTYASGGIGTASHLAGELFKSMAGVDVVHIPYKGNAPALADLVGGHLTMQFATMPTVISQVRDGRLRALGVIGSTRSEALPGVPTIAESGVNGYVVNNWIGVFAPAGTPPAIVTRLNAEIMKIMKTPDVQRRMETEGARFSPNTPEEFRAFVRSETVKWASVVEAAGIKAQ